MEIDREERRGSAGIEPKALWLWLHRAATTWQMWKTVPLSFLQFGTLFSFPSFLCRTVLCSIKGSAHCQFFMVKIQHQTVHNLKYRIVASSRPVYYSILDPLGKRSQYISIKFPFINSLKIWKCATNQDSLLLAPLW